MGLCVLSSKSITWSNLSQTYCELCLTSLNFIIEIPAVVRNYIALLLTLFLLASCQKDSGDSPVNDLDPNVSIENLVVSPDFDFRTEEQITLSINDPETYRVKYTVYAAFDGQQEEKIASFLSTGNTMNVKLTVPTFCNRLKVERNANGAKSADIVDISGNGAAVTFSKNLGKAMNCVETLYAVNGQGGFYTLDVKSGTYAATTMPNLAGGGSIACAIDQENGIMYYNTGNLALLRLYRWHLSRGPKWKSI